MMEIYAYTCTGNKIAPMFIVSYYDITQSVINFVSNCTTSDELKINTGAYKKSRGIINFVNT